MVEGKDGLAGDVGDACRALWLVRSWQHTTTQCPPWSPHGGLDEVVMCPELARVPRQLGFPPPGFPPPAAAAGVEAA